MSGSSKRAKSADKKNIRSVTNNPINISPNGAISVVYARRIYPDNFPIPPDRLGKKKLALILKQELKDWTVVKSPLPENVFIIREELFREFFFKEFDQVLEFMTKVGAVCNALPHHPRWENTWTTLKVYLSTWDGEHIISFKDIMLARHMEEIYKDFGMTYYNIHSDTRIASERKQFYKEIAELNAKGKLEEAFNKLIQITTQPWDLKERDKIVSLVDDFSDFIRDNRLNKLSVAAVTKKTKLFQIKLAEILTTFEYKPKVFFSYARGKEREKIVDDLYISLSKGNEFELVRDKVDLGYKGLISEFIKDIGKGNFVIVAVSDKYLKSEYCMFELYELYRNSYLDNKELVKKIYPIRVESLDLDNPDIIIDYVNYWHSLEQKWAILGNRFPEKYQKIQSINFALGKLLSLLSDINSLTNELLSADDFDKIKTAIKERVSG